MSAALGEGLKRLVPEGKYQSNLANEWVDLWSKRYRGTPVPSVETVEARLRECLLGRLPGIRFLFQDEARRALTFDVFAAPDHERERLGGLAARALSTEGPVRLVVDVASGPQDGARAESLWEGLHRLLFGPDTLTPMAIVLTEAQYEKLPRSFDELVGLVRFEKVAHLEAARQRVEELAADPAAPLVASPRPRHPFERWAALRVEGDVALGPADAIAVMQARGSLDALPRVTKPLSRIASPDGDKDLPTSDPPRLRKLAIALCRGQVYLTPDWGPAARATSAGDQEAPPVGVTRRLSWARQLGVEACATEEEWSTALPKRLAPVPVLEQSLLPHVLRHAAYTPDPVVVLDGNLLHAVNPSAHVRAELLGLAVEEHLVPPTRRTNVEAYFAAAAALTPDALLDDPFLERLTATFIADEEDARVFGLARTALLFWDRPRVAVRVPVPAWREAMRGLLASPAATPATLRLEGKAGDPSSRERPREGHERPWSHFLRASALLPEGEPWLGPLTAITARREAPLWVVCPKDSHVPGAERAAEKTVEIPFLGDQPARWADELVAGLAPRLVRGQAFRTASAPVVLSARHATKVVIDPWLWDAADRELAFVLHALRQAVRDEGSNELPLPNGNVLLGIGQGIFAEIAMREDASVAARPLEASLFHPFDASMHRQLPLDGTLSFVPLVWSQPDAARSSVQARSGLQLPHALYLAGQGVRADIRFHASLLLAPSASLPSLATSAAALGR